MFIIENNVTRITNFNHRMITILYDYDDDTNTNTNETTHMQSHSPQERKGQGPQTPEREDRIQFQFHNVYYTKYLPSIMYFTIVKH